MARPGGCEFSVVGVLIVPTVVSTVWFVVMGGTAIDIQLNGVADMAGSPGQQRREHQRNEQAEQRGAQQRGGVEH